jgi:hypothetical protein
MLTFKSVAATRIVPPLASMSKCDKMGNADLAATTVFTRLTVSKRSCRGIVIFMDKAPCSGAV